MLDEKNIGNDSSSLSNWRASEASETLSCLFNRESRIYNYIIYILLVQLEKWFPFVRERAHS